MSLCFFFSFLFFFLSPFEILEIGSRFLDHLCYCYHLLFFEDREASNGPNKERNEE